MLKRTYIKGLVNILVPCYNGEQYINRFMQSLSEQSYKDIELIIVNDGSTDNSEKLILEWQDKLSLSTIRVKYVFQSNTGIGGAINNALKHITGEFFVWFNIDDILTKDCIRLMVEFLEMHNEYALVRPNVFIVDEFDVNKVLYLINDYNSDASKEYLFKNAINEKNFTFGCSMLRTEIFDEVNPRREIYESRQGQNWQLLLPILYEHKSGYIDIPLYSVVEQQESTSRVKTYEKRIKQLIEYENILVNTINRMNLPDIEKKDYINGIRNRYAHWLFRVAIFNDDFSRATKYYNFLKKEKLLTKNERKIYHNRVKRIDYWLYLKNKILGRNKEN